MKKLVFLFCCLICLQNTISASIYIIGNDTIHFEAGNYFVISTADTFYIDSTLIFVKYDVLAETEDKTEIESTYHLIKDFEFIFGWTSYSYDLENTEIYQFIKRSE